MTEQRSRGPIEWFVSACLLVLVGVVALSLSLQLLARIWPWLLLVAVAVLGLWISFVLWQARRQRW